MEPEKRRLFHRIIHPYSYFKVYRARAWPLYFSYPIICTSATISYIFEVSKRLNSNGSFSAYHASVVDGETQLGENPRNT